MLKPSASRAPVSARSSFVMQLVMFFGVGAVATAFHYLVMIALADGAGIDPVAAAACGYASGAVVSYLLNYLSLIHI